MPQVQSLSTGILILLTARHHSYPQRLFTSGNQLLSWLRILQTVLRVGEMDLQESSISLRPS